MVLFVLNPMYDITADKNRPYNFGIKHIDQRVFTETPTIKRNLQKIIEEKHLRHTLLKERETFVERPEDFHSKSSAGRPLNTKQRVSTVDENIDIIESFGPKKQGKVANMIDKFFSTVAVVVFIIFVCYIFWICFVDDDVHTIDIGKVRANI